VKLAAADLMGLEQYARERVEFRARVLEHKRARQLAVGPDATWSFEDRLTVQYQIQEMLRIERVFEPQGIADELAAYNPLIPDGSNWKVTLLIEFAEPEIADEDLPRENEEKTSAVHFLRFELSSAMRAALHAGAQLAVGVDHEHYRYAVDPVPAAVRGALAADLT
jgi:Protein of unknown function (DUF3501)